MTTPSSGSARIFILAVAVAGAFMLPGVCRAADVSSDAAEVESQYQTLLADLNKENRDRFENFKDETFHPSSLIQAGDRDPLDILLRRTRVLLDDIKSMPGAPSTDAVETKLAGMEKEASGLAKQLLTFSAGGAPIRESMDIVVALKETVNFMLSGLHRREWGR